MSIFPFIDGTEKQGITTEELPVLKEYAYDFQNNELLLDENGCTYMVEGNEALRIWIFKALTTERCHYTAYSFDFGSEYQEKLIGHAMDSDVMKLEMQRYITEALMVNPYIKQLDNFVFLEMGSGMTISFECFSVYGEEKITFPTEEVAL